MITPISHILVKNKTHIPVVTFKQVREHHTALHISHGKLQSPDRGALLHTHTLPSTHS